jgi:hypothetical protein
LSCALVKALAEQQQQQQTQDGSAVKQQQQQLFTLLLSTLKLTMASQQDVPAYDVLCDLHQLLRCATKAAATLSNSSSSSDDSSSSSSSSNDAVALWVLVIARTMVCIGQQLPAVVEENDADDEDECQTEDELNDETEDEEEGSDGGDDGSDVFCWLDTAAVADAASWVSSQLPLLTGTHASSSTAAAPPQGSDQQPSSSSSSRKGGRLVLQQLLSEQTLPLQSIIASCKREGKHGDWTAADYSNMTEQLLSCGEALVTALPSKLCCNHSRCSSMARPSEAELVGGKGCVCGRCEGR